MGNVLIFCTLSPSTKAQIFGPFAQTEHSTETQILSNGRAGHTIDRASVGRMPVLSSTAVAAKVSTQLSDVVVTDALIQMQATHQNSFQKHNQTATQETLLHSPLTHKTEIHKYTPVTPIKVEKLIYYLKGYNGATFLIEGFQSGFHLGYTGPSTTSVSPNLKSCNEYPHIVAEKIQKEVLLGGVKGPFSVQPFPNMKISPIGIVPKKSPGQYRLIQHLSYPNGQSVNDFIDNEFSSVQYTTFDDAINCLLKVGQGCLMAKTDIDSAFRLMPLHPSDHPLLGFRFQHKIYSDTCVPFGASSSCSLFRVL